jgi:hypothetical protein
MNRLNLLMMRWKKGLINDPDLSLTLKYINDNVSSHERESTNIPGTDPVSGKDNSTEPKRFKAKGLRPGIQSGSDRTNAQDQTPS